MIPLVDAWLDVGQYLSEDEIPNPLELREEVVKIHSIIKQGLVRLATLQKTASQIKEEHPVISTDSDLTVEPEDYWPEGHPSSMTELDALFKYIQRSNVPTASGHSESTSSVRTPQPGSPELRVRHHAVSKVVSSEIDDRQKTVRCDSAALTGVSKSCGGVVVTFTDRKSHRV
ncbi:hypothetical protein K466DRAFT_598973 [Polyporus arcularius HHB13444]|uniref:Uncharacterized protein n=1 Tax=Polyporus arcularius HHB13444 TaxID=1314778 RepID=A0A5C3PE70_9APHY|nr:hypothetical protein K466DRAFT_598973 [Polyporus arcularius HHB13444]